MKNTTLDLYFDKIFPFCFYGHKRCIQPTIIFFLSYMLLSSAFSTLVFPFSHIKEAMQKISFLILAFPYGVLMLYIKFLQK